MESLNIVKKYLEQQRELGWDEIYVPVKAKNIFTTPEPGSLKAKEEIKKNAELHKFYLQIKDCTKCVLSKSRTKFVFGTGNRLAKLMLIGEAPGRQEDLQGEPFVGEAGQLLNNILKAINLNREDVYIANIVKCRPPENREPQPEEIESCRPYLMRQIELVKPKLILCLGRVAAQALLKTKLSLGQLRGKFHDFRGIQLLVTYHPAALLRYPVYKKQTWEDIKKLKTLYDRV